MIMIMIEMLLSMILMRKRRTLVGHDTCHCFGPIYCFTAFMHYYTVAWLGRHVRALWSPRISAVYSIYRIYVYSVIDPSGTFSFRLRYSLMTCCFWCCVSLWRAFEKGETIVRYFFHWFWFYTPLSSLFWIFLFSFSRLACGAMPNISVLISCLKWI